jgi:hypothetical protein
MLANVGTIPKFKKKSCPHSKYFLFDVEKIRESMKKAEIHVRANLSVMGKLEMGITN